MAFKVFRKNCCGLDVHKTWIYACIGITDTNGRTEYRQSRFSSFSRGLLELADWLSSYSCKEVCMESAGKYWIPVFNILEKTCWVTLAHPKYTKPQKGNKTDRKDAKWICDLFMCDMIKPSFIPPPDIRQLRDLMRYRMKLTNMLTGEKNRASNCLTVSNLKLDDVFSDVFGKSSRSIISCILEHPGDTFDVKPFVDRRCKHPIEEIQAAVDGAVSREQAAKLKECLQHIDEINAHKKNIETEILRLTEQCCFKLSSVLPGVGQGHANWAFGRAAAVADVQTNAMLALPERGEIPRRASTHPPVTGVTAVTADSVLDLYRFSRHSRHCCHWQEPDVAPGGHGCGGFQS